MEIEREREKKKNIDDDAGHFRSQAWEGLPTFHWPELSHLVNLTSEPGKCEGVYGSR